MVQDGTWSADALLRTARENDASDIHIVTGIPPAFRIHGDMVYQGSVPLTREQSRQLTFDMLTEAQREALERDWELCFSVQHDEFGRFRVTCYYHGRVPEMAIRLCRSEIPSRESLGLPPIVDQLALKKNGLVLITGPTGTGKTTTMNYMLDLINNERRCKIVTIEDPIEFLHEHHRAVVVQQEVLSDVKSFSRALIHVLRQDPDVICIGEMRDLETISTALVAAETGHLVLATIHTPNALQTVERIISVFPAEQQNRIIAQMANSLQGIVAQLLLRGAGGDRRVLASEILIANNAVRAVIRENALHKLESIMQTSREEGMRTMDSCLRDLYRQGAISYEVAATYARDPRRLKDYEMPTR